MSDIPISIQRQNHLPGHSFDREIQPSPVEIKELEGHDLLSFLTNQEYNENNHIHILPGAACKNTDDFYHVTLTHYSKNYELQIRMNNDGSIIIKNENNSVIKINPATYNNFPLNSEDHHLSFYDHSSISTLLTRIILNKALLENKFPPVHTSINIPEEAHILNYDLNFIDQKIIDKIQTSKQPIYDGVSFDDEFILTGCQPKIDFEKYKELFSSECLKLDFSRMDTTNTIVSINDVSIPSDLLQQIIKYLGPTNQHSEPDLDNAIFLAIYDSGINLPSDVINNLHLISVANSQAITGRALEIFCTYTAQYPTLKKNTKSVIDIKINDRDFLIKTKYDISILNASNNIRFDGYDFIPRKATLWNVVQGDKFSLPVSFTRWDSGFSAVCEPINK